MKRSDRKSPAAAVPRWLAARFIRLAGRLGEMIILTAALGFGAAYAAPVLLIDSAGKLTGATGVVVNGTTYEVTFKTGSCTALFDGCDSASDFVFQNAAAAVEASRALLDSVFVDTAAGAFDTQPGLTAGCLLSNTLCQVATPFGSDVFSSDFFLPPVLQALVNYAVNFAGIDGQVTTSAPADFDFGASLGDRVYAVWAPSPPTTGSAPEPTALAILGAGLLALTATRRRRSQSR